MSFNVIYTWSPATRCTHEWRYTDVANPCAGVKGHREGRDRYIEDDEYRAVWEKMHFTMQDAMDVPYLTGQRPGDVLGRRKSATVFAEERGDFVESDTA